MVGLYKTFSIFAMLLFRKEYYIHIQIIIMKHNTDLLQSDGTLLNIIYQKKHGYISNLKNEIGEEAVSQLEAMGYIQNAPNPDGDAWKITERALKRAKLFYEKPTLWECLKDWFYLHIRRIDFSY